MMIKKIVRIDRLKQEGIAEVSMGDLGKIVDSIRNYGILTPIVIDQENNVIDGKIRLLAAKMIKISYIPVEQLYDGSNNGDIFLDAIIDFLFIEKRQ